ncbi:uncharacterized protein LOC129284048 isoform X3 [Lytechinus pictus]|uniref:uncharacterized protein LOC129284048 isoform X3 n=1 Tax=Lytechinus pictus TaxID=7653 RepID=UPI0030B9D08D
MDTIEFMSVLDEIIDILSSCESTINADSDECFVCSNDIKENESDATCECCSKQFHVTCMGFPCEDKLSNLKLIWICSFCGNSNIAHRMFDKVCIPSHFNRYELLVDQGDEECITDMPNQSTKKRDGRKCTRSKKRSRICECTEFMLVARKKNKTRTTKEDKTSKRTLPCPSNQADVKMKHVFKKCRSKWQLEEEIYEVVDKSPETFQDHVDPKGKKRRLTLETEAVEVS